jgi:hypothetical protein
MAERDLNAEMQEWQQSRNLKAEMEEWQSKKQPAPWYEQAYEGLKDLSEGLGVSGLKTYYGAKDLIGMGSPEDRQTLEAWKKAAGDSGMGAIGEIAGDVGQLVAPGMGGLRAAKALEAAGKATTASRALPVAADIAGGAAHGYVSLPGEGETRLGEAAEEAAWAGGGAAVGKVLKTALAGATGSEVAQRLRDQGAKLTIGQTIPAMQKIENLLSVVPFTARPLIRAREKSRKSLEKIAMQRAAPPTSETLTGLNPVAREVSNVGQKGVDELYNAFQEAYGQVWGKMDDLNDFGLRLNELLKRQQGRLGKSDWRKVQNVLQDMNAKYQKGRSAQVLDTTIRDALPSASSAKNRDLRSALGEIRSELRASLPEESQIGLKRLDELWPNYKVLEGATGTPAARKKARSAQPGEIDVEELTTGITGATTKRQRGRGIGPMMDLEADWYAAKGTQPGILPSWAMRAIQSPLFSDFTGLQGTLNRRIAGTGIGQKNMRDLIQQYQASALRDYISPARFGAALEE